MKKNMILKSIPKYIFLSILFSNLFFFTYSQTNEDELILKAKEVCTKLSKGTFVRVDGKLAIKLIASEDGPISESNNQRKYFTGDVLILKSDMMYDVYDGLSARNNNWLKKGTFKWKCENLTNSLAASNPNSNQQNSNSSSSSCNLTFSKPKINFTLVDNRKLCRCCNERYAMYELNDLNKDKATAETFYLETLLKKHFEDTNADEAHQENDRARLNSYILENYGLIGSLNNLMTPILNQLGNLMLGEGKLSNHILTRERNIDKYVNKSDYCSRKCEIYCN